jgi:hypothetical protein
MVDIQIITHQEYQKDRQCGTSNSLSARVGLGDMYDMNSVSRFVQTLGAGLSASHAMALCLV